MNNFDLILPDIFLIVFVIAILYVLVLRGKRTQNSDIQVQKRVEMAQSAHSNSISKSFCPTPEQLAQAQERTRATIERQLKTELETVDNMAGGEFEEYVAQLLRYRGFETEVTKQSGDYGVDIVAEFQGRRYAVQVKRQTQKVSRHAVSDAVAGQAYYTCSCSMVVTNNYFHSSAQELAAVNGCELVDREMLAQWIGQKLASYLHIPQYNHVSKKTFDTTMSGTKREQTPLIDKLSTHPIVRQNGIVIEQVDPRHRNYVFYLLQKYLSAGHQGIIIYPICWSHRQIRSMFEMLCNKLRNSRIGLIDEYTSYEEIDELKHGFNNGEVKVILSTTTDKYLDSNRAVRIVVIENANEFTQPELHRFYSILLDKPGKAHMLLVSDSAGLIETFQ